MTNEELEAIKEIKGYLEYCKEEYGSTDKEIEILLNLVERLNIELELKDNIINEMKMYGED